MQNFTIGDGLLVSLIGFTVVFVVLVLLICAVKLMTLILGKGKTEQTTSAPVPAPAAATAMSAAGDALSPEAMAAITGALAVALQKDVGQLVIRDIKPIV